MTVYTRKSRLNEHFTERSLAEFVEPRPPVPFDLGRSRLSRGELIRQMIGAGQWRYHHHIPELAAHDELYLAYAARIDTMMTMIETGLDRYGLTDRLPDLRIADLACSEGFVSRRLVDLGARQIDAYELSRLGLDRMSWVWSYLGLHDRAQVAAYVLDLEQVGWATLLPRAYDLVFCLGIIYHVENPSLFARNLYAATEEFCIVESDTPVFENPCRFRRGGVVYLHRDKVTIEDGQVRKIMEFRPDLHALIDILLTAGFASVDVLPSPPDATSPYYASGEKSVLLCRR